MPSSRFFQVEFKIMILSTAEVNGVAILTVEMEGADWLPVRPRLNHCWLRSLLAQALRNYFIARWGS